LTLTSHPGKGLVLRSRDDLNEIFEMEEPGKMSRDGEHNVAYFKIGDAEKA